MSDTDELLRSSGLIQRWERVWDAPGLTERITCEWSPRLRRSLGRAYPERMLIRLSLLLQEPEFAWLFREVLCHEAAHLAVHHIHGSRAAHGDEWRELVRRAGYEPRSSYRTDSLPECRVHDSVRYDHICPICHAKRSAKLPQPAWRCVACQNAGLDGELIIQSRPRVPETVNG